MTQRCTDELIHSLSRSLAPVRTLAPPGVRALKWLTAVAVVFGVFIALRGHVALFVSRLSRDSQQVVRYLGNDMLMSRCSPTL